MSIEILVIGPDPPCIRCLTTFKYASEIANQYPGKVQARKIFTTSEEAKKYGKALGGHDIAQIEKVEHDHQGIEKLMKEISELKANEEKNKELIEMKMQAIQGKLTPVVDKADESGYLMTPVLIVNGQVKTKGVVPAREQIREWVESVL